MKKYFYCIFFMLLLLTGQAKAIEEELDPIYFDKENNVIYGETKKDYVYALDNFLEDAKTSGANLDIIRREDIKKQNTPSFSDLLNQVGGVTVQNGNGSEGSVSSVRIRGTDRVKMTVDGIRADRPSLTTSGVEPQFLLLDDIEQIEIIKGAQGNIGGTNASGGIIAMQTRRGRGPLKFELGSDFGTYGTFKERFAVMAGNERADYYLSTTWFKTDGGMRTSNLGRIYNDDYNNFSTVANLGLRVLDGKAEIRDTFRLSRARKENGIGDNSLTWTSYRDPNNYSINLDLMNTLAFKHAPTEKYNYDVKFGLYHNQNEYNGIPDNIDPYYTSLSDLASTRLNLMTQHNFDLTSWNTLSLGYNFETEFLDGSSYMGSTLFMPPYNFPYGDKSDYSGNTIQNDVYINDVINIKDKLFIRGGARVVENSQYGFYVAPNASAALILPTFKLNGATTKFRGSWGQSVNTPTLYQRYARLNYMGFPSMVGNPDLNAEKYQSWDVGIEQSFFDDKLKFEFGYFNSSYKDYIAYVSDALTYIGKYDNINRARLQGFEGKASWEPNEKFKIVMNYTYTDAEDKDTGYDLPATPKNRINGTIYYTPFERWSMYLGVETASSRTYSASSTDRTSGYVDAKLGTSVRLFSFRDVHLYFKANIYNLFNQKICVYRDFYKDNYYAPKLRFVGGLFLEYNIPDKMKL